MRSPSPRPAPLPVRAAVALAAALLAAPADAAPKAPAPKAPVATSPAWPCPVAACTWAPDGRYLPLDTPGFSATAETPYTFAVPTGATVVAVVILPEKATQGNLGKAAWDGLPAWTRTDLLGGRQVWAPTETSAWPNVYPVPLGTGKTAKGAAVPLHATLLALTVPPGATTLRITPDKRAPMRILAAAAWSADPPFPFTPERVVADATWAPFELRADETLALPRPAALGPLGPIAGFVRREGEALRDDAGPVHFYGTNLPFGWEIPAPAESERVAKAMAALGFNLVRLSIFPVSRVTLYEGGAARLPTEEEWDRLDALVDALARHGIRVQFPLVETDPQWAAQTVSAQTERAQVAHLLPFFDADARARQKAYIQAFLAHPNKRRGVPFAEDPAVAIVEVSNESGLLRGFLSGSYDQLPTAWRAKIQARWNTWLRARYPNDAALAAAWTGGASPGLQPDESLEKGTVDVGPRSPNRWKLWPEARRRDLAVFHAELDEDYFGDMTRFVRQEIGAEALVVGTQYMGIVTGSRVQAGAMLGDVHYQYDHPGGSPPEQTRRPLTALPVDKALRVLVNHAVHGQPLHVGESNYGWPSPYEYEGPLLFASLAARQGWAGVSWFIWRHGPWSPEGPGRIEGQMDIAENPVKIGQLPIAAAIVRGGLLPAAEGLCPTPLPNAVPDDPDFPLTAPEAGHGDGQSLLDCRWRTVYDGVPPAANGTKPGPVTWDTAATFVVDAPGVAAVLTDGDRRATKVFSAGGAPGAVSAVGLDAVALADAKKWLLVVASRALNTGHRELGDFTITSYGEAPVRLQPWAGEIVLVGTQKRMPTVTRLGADGRPAERIPATWTSAGWRLDLAAAPPSPWYVVEWPG